MRVDVSEVKTWKDCKRKHLFNSRNRYHLVPNKPNDNLIFGTQFHEVLHMIYMGVSIDKILEWIDREVTDSVYWKAMNNMAQGYYNGPYQKDKDRYVVIDIEKKFDYPAISSGFDDEPVRLCGSIDMVCIDVLTGKLCGFEHKTAKNFRPDVYNIIDEQPRVYTWALKKILDDYHRHNKYLEITEVDCIYLNQVKKLQTKFEFQRTECRYSEEDLNNFMDDFCRTIHDITTGDADTAPCPGFMKCQMCDYADLCMHYGYKNVEKEDILEEFADEFQERDHDHLDEKTQRHVDE
mgnify:CR=1 FL=1